MDDDDRFCDCEVTLTVTDEAGDDHVCPAEPPPGVCPLCGLPIATKVE